MINAHGDRVFGEYLRRSNEARRDVTRELSPQDTQTIAAFMDVWYAYGAVITQLFTLIAILEEMNEPRLQYVVRNAYRVINSMAKQRELMTAARRTFMTYAPSDEERREVENFIRRCGTRVEFIEKTVIEGNIELTPLHEYLEGTGASFKEDAMRYFGGKSAMCAANKKENNGVARYVSHILGTLEERGALEDYRKRLDRYILLADEKAEKAKAEKAAEKRTAMDRKLRDCMDVFRRRFHKAMDDLEADGLIGVTPRGIEAQIAKHGRRAYVILRCSIWRDRPMFRYMKGNGDFTGSFCSAKVYATEKEAEEQRAVFQREQKNALLEVAQISIL